MNKLCLTLLLMVSALIGILAQADDSAAVAPSVLPREQIFSFEDFHQSPDAAMECTISTNSTITSPNRRVPARDPLPFHILIPLSIGKTGCGPQGRFSETAEFPLPYIVFDHSRRGPPVFRFC